MRKLVASVIAALIAGPLIFTGTASAEQPTFFCWLKDQGPGSENPYSDKYAEVPDNPNTPRIGYATKALAQKAGYIRCFAQRP
ncbi:MAG TPA: hypothetical protein VGL46_08090 [Pseudonocardiaceae bacterium]|jgi:hypothetical protein